MKADGLLPEGTKVRSSKYLNNLTSRSFGAPGPALPAIGTAYPALSTNRDHDLQVGRRGTSRSPK